MPGAEGTHPSDEALELYSLGRLSEEEAPQIEEHVLVCEDCQSRLKETDEYVAAMRQALHELDKQPESATERPAPPQTFFQRVPKPVWAGALAAVALLIVILPNAVAPGPPYEVELAAYRGDAPSTRLTAPAGRPLTVRLDLTGLAPQPVFTVEVVDAGGKSVWRQPVTPAGEEAAAALTEPLDAGQYWVRLYGPIAGASGSGEILREFSLLVQ